MNPSGTYRVATQSIAGLNVARKRQQRQNLVIDMLLLLITTHLDNFSETKVFNTRNKVAGMGLTQACKKVLGTIIEEGNHISKLRDNEEQLLDFSDRRKKICRHD